jgi:DNA-directed RNA polymerase II subunit RPB2
LFFDFNLCDHHVKPFDECLKVWLKNIVLNNGNITTNHEGKLYKLTLKNYRFVRGSMTASEAHLYNSSYVGEVLVDIEELHLGQQQTSEKSHHGEYPYVHKCIVHRGVKIVDFPVMIQSKGCHFSEGFDIANQNEPEYAGSFIVKGKRRFIPLLKSVVNNFPFRFNNKKKLLFCVQVRSEHLDRKHRSTSTIEFLLDEIPTKRCSIFHEVSVKIPFLSSLVPMTVLVLASGISLNKFKNYVRLSWPHLYCEKLFRKYFITLDSAHRGCSSQEEAFKYINRLNGKNEDNSYAQHMLKSEVLPHLNNYHHVSCKSFYLAYVYGMIVLFKEGKLSATDRDDRSFTRLVDPATSLTFLFRMLFLTFMKQALKIMRRVLNKHKPIEVLKIYNHRRLTQKLLSALATGTWSKQRKGVSHPMNTINSQAIVAQLRRISSSYLNNDGKHVGPRMVHPSQFGYECAAETPEGEACGLVYSMASTTRLTAESDSSALMAYLLDTAGDLVIPFDGRDITDDYKLGVQNYKVFDAHGRFIGWCCNLSVWQENFLKARRSMSIDPYASQFVDHEMKEWRVYCDIGRPCRPLLVASRISKMACALENWNKSSSLVPYLMTHGILEYVTPAEEKNLTVSFERMKELEGSKITHYEITNVSFVGIVAALSPFFRHNQGPRLVYWISMSKQAICSSSSRDKGSVTTHNLWYGQKPLVSTLTSRQLNMDQIPDGINVVLCMYPHSRAQEDAIVMSQSFIDKGGFVSDSVRTYNAEKRSEYAASQFENPDKHQTFGLKLADYSKIHANGLPLVGTYVKGGDVIIGKTAGMKKISNAAAINAPKRIRSSEYQKKKKDCSVQVRDDEYGRVHSTLLTHKPDCDIAKVCVRTTRRPEIGDKFSSRHSQKGTIGMVARPEDMPFSMNTGMIPDVIMSPLGITSRMTMGKVIETLLGKAACLTGDLLDCLDDQDFQTPFEQRLETIQNIFKKAGFSSSGKEIFCDGKTGEMVEIPIMVGIVSYAKLNHMVARKAHARSTGQVHVLTRQPNEGRRQGGGLRFGPMEAECVIAHSAAEILRERTLSAADPFTCFVCKECGQIADGNQNIGYYFCRLCRTNKHVREVEMGFATKLLTQELGSTGIKVKLGLKDKIL